MDKKQEIVEEKIEVKKSKYQIDKFQVRDFIDDKIILNIDGFGVLFSGKTPNGFKPTIGGYINIKHAGKNDKTKELKDAEIIV